MVNLTDSEWVRVFALRCRAKQGHEISRADQRLLERANRADPERYGKMDRDVFNATVPFGSGVRR